MPLEVFTFQGESDNFLRITLEEVYGFPESTCTWGGYEVRTVLEIKSSDFTVNSTLWTSTGEISKLFEELQQCHKALSGKVQYDSYEHHLSFIVSYHHNGHVTIKGSFSSERMDCFNTLEFEFLSDQTFIHATLMQLKKIVSKYGDIKGLH